MKLDNVLLVAAGTLTGLFAGLLYSFSVAVVPGLRAIKANAHIAAMQAINVKIENPVFFLSFVGPIILLPLSAYTHRGTDAFGLLVAAALLHIIGACGVTGAGNIPLNNKLAALNVSNMSDAELNSARKEYQGAASTWMVLHTIRTLAATAALILVLWALIVIK